MQFFFCLLRICFVRLEWCDLVIAARLTAQATGSFVQLMLGGTLLPDLHSLPDLFSRPSRTFYVSAVEKQVWRCNDVFTCPFLFFIADSLVPNN